MKKLMLSVVIVCFIQLGQAQEPLSYEFVIQKEGVSAAQIYNQLVDWIATNFKAVDGDFYRDKEDKMITKDAMFDFNTGKLTMICYDGKISYKLKFQCRDGRFKMELTNFNHSVNPRNNQGCALGLILSEPERKNYGQYDEKAWEKIKEACDAEASRLQKVLEGLTFNTSNDDW